jgi:hypothetical protein
MSEEIKTEEEQKDNMQLTTEHSSPPECTDYGDGIHCVGDMVYSLKLA